MVTDYTGRQYFSASKYNAYARELQLAFGRASQPIAPFSKLLNAYVYTGSFSNAWEGWFIYTGRTNDLVYDITDNNTNGTTRLIVNGTIVEEWDGVAGQHTGTEDLTSLGLTIGTAYKVQISGIDNGGGANVLVDWLGMEYDPSFTSPPTFNTEMQFTQLEDIADGINEIIENNSLPPATFPYHQETNGLPNDTPVDIWKGEIVHTHNTLSYRIFNDSASSTKGELVFYINGVEVGTERGQDYADGTINITSQGLTRGTKYEVKAAVRRYDSASIETVIAGVVWFVEENTLESLDAVTEFSAGDLVNDNARHNWLRDVINDVHPGATSPTVPFYYRQPIVKVSPQGKWFWRRCKNTLFYVHDGSANTPEIHYGGSEYDENSQDLSTGSGAQTYNIDENIPALYTGLFCQGDDSDYMQEYDV